MDNSSGPSEVLDKVAVALSGLCLVHCLALPLLIVILPFSGQFSDDHLHMQMLILVIPVSVVALTLGFRGHRHPGVVIAGVAGMIIITFGGMVAHDHYGLLTDRLLTIIGSLVLAITHYRNFRLSRHIANPNSE
ncbi:MAG: MerC domain-containing protein [Woeseiaceae bacterium]|nr:MerC domain-containing protein [Woeseiaceae bacterium]